MVAITVILAAILGSFVLDFEKSAEEDSPQASFRVSADPATDEIELEHLGGDGLRHDDTRIVVEHNGTTTFEPVPVGGSEGILSVGETAVINLTASDDTLDFDGDGTIDITTSGAAEPFDAGDRVTVTLIDTATQRIIFERTVQVQ
jgi:FlaG/FlaF family flagellin (archaellin)